MTDVTTEIKNAAQLYKLKCSSLQNIEMKMPRCNTEIKNAV